MTDIILHKIDDSFTFVNTSAGIEDEISDRFSFMANNYRFSPEYRARYWDGRVRLYDKRSHVIYTGLLPKLISYAKKEGLTVSLENFSKSGVSSVGADDFIAGLNLPFELYDYQENAIRESIKTKRRLIRSPTSSGKTPIIYGISRYFAEAFAESDKKVLVIVPTIMLVTQIAGDFVDYGWDSNLIHQIYGGCDKNSDCPVYVSTWQSLLDLDENWFKKFGAVIVDEAHNADAKCLRKIMESCENASIRIGTTGTLKENDPNTAHRLILEGLFGPLLDTISTAQMIERGIAPRLNIKVLLLKHAPLPERHSYQKEIKALVSDTERNLFISKLVGNLKGNTLILFNYVEKHGIPLFNKIKEMYPDRPIYYVSGVTDISDRNQVKDAAAKYNNCIFVCSYGTFSTGISIKQIHNIIFASPYKSQVKVLQSIGRGLRKFMDKVLTVYDIADDYGPKSYGLKHLGERIRIYIREQLPYRILDMSSRDSL